MNIKKIKRNIFLNRFKHQQYFDVIDIIFRDDLIVQAKKVKTKSDFKQYVVGLNTYYNDAYFLYPMSSFSTKNFNTSVDIVIIGIDLKIKKLYSNVEINTKFFFNFDFYNILILEKGFIKFNKIEKDSYIKLSMHSSV